MNSVASRALAEKIEELYDLIESTYDECIALLKELQLDHDSHTEQLHDMLARDINQ